MTTIDRGFFNNWIHIALLFLVSWQILAKVPNQDEITQRLEATLKQDRGPGMMVAVMKDGKLLYNKAIGYADLEQNIPLQNHTRMRIW